MHDTAIANGKRFFDTYVEKLSNSRIVDIGSLNVNGSLKQCAPQNGQYVGIDFVAGKGVDTVLSNPYEIPLESESVDVVVSSSCFEHSEMFWVLFLEILRVLKPNGIFYLNVPSNGPIHRYPVDCWRFYPDSGHALVAWAKKNLLNPAVLESYTSNQMIESWNDYVCVFVKDESHVADHSSRIIDTFSDFTNGYRYGSSNRVNESIRTEDHSSFGWKVSKRISQVFQRS